MAREILAQRKEKVRLGGGWKVKKEK